MFKNVLWDSTALSAGSKRHLFSFPPRFLSVGGRWQPLDLLGCASTGMFSGDLKQSMTLLPTPGRWAEWVFRFHINLDQQFSTSVLQGFSKHATPDYLVRGFDNCSVRLSKKMTAANTVIGAGRCECPVLNHECIGHIIELRLIGHIT